MIHDKNLFPIFEDAESIDSARWKLNDLSRNMQEDNPELGDYQKDAIAQLKTLLAYSEDVATKCKALLAQSEGKGCALSEAELEIMRGLK